MPFGEKKRATVRRMPPVGTPPAASWMPQDALRAAFAERRLADERGAAVVLESAGENLGGAGGVVVDQDDQRDVRGVRILGVIDEVLRRVLMHARGDDAVREELLGGVDGAFDDAAAVLRRSRIRPFHAGLLEVPVEVTHRGVGETRDLEMEVRRPLHRAERNGRLRRLADQANHA